MTSLKYTPRDTIPQHNLSSPPPLGQSLQQSGVCRETVANGSSFIFPQVYPAEQPKQTTYSPPGASPSHFPAAFTTAVSLLSERAASLRSNWYTESPFMTHLKHAPPLWIFRSSFHTRTQSLALRSHLYPPTRSPTNSLRIRIIRLIFTTKMPKFRGDRRIHISYMTWYKYYCGFWHALSII